ncbi:M48 family metalloprotease [Undibacterium sp. LX40W]|uniref:M48 family metalloprotease n=1 Tax=Undibacterium nitidum TaxID=2762298 RepID=A0A923HXC3_9BURK|nr:MULTISPECIES: M56 family metallopeptidase [Undibacterium]MBC3883134.1 M48 family metalloprotease [Undibacterium nitidum]MBC3893416.1 M48 family metalloprotease [Undibacterium sp. LX40W]
MNLDFANSLSTLGWALLHFVWQGALLASITALGLFALRRKSAQWRYLLACSALILCAAFPISYVIQHSDSVVITDLSASATTVEVAELAPVPTANLSSDLSLWSQISSTTESFLKQQMPLLVIIWAIGVLVLALRMALGMLWVRQQIAHAEQHVHPMWQAKVNDFARRLGMQENLRLGLSYQLESPMTAGWWKPIVILPSSLLTGMPAELIEALLAHEVAHVKRMDYVVNLFQSAIEIALFYHPAVWWISKQIRMEREQIADDLAAGLLGEPRRLALALSELEQFQFSHPQPALSAHGGNLMSRIKRLVRPELPAKAFSWKLTLPLLGISSACAVLVAQATAINVTPSTPAAVSLAAPAAIPVAFSAPAPDKAARKQLREAAVEMPMALVSGNKDGHYYMSGSSKDHKEIERLKQERAGEFLWFKEEGKSYVIQDSKTLQQVHEAFKPVNQLSAEMEEQGKKMEAQGEVMEAIGKEMEAIHIDEAKIDRAVEVQMQALEKKMEVFEKKMEAAAEKMVRAKDKAERDKAQKHLNEVQASMEVAAKQIQVKSEKIKVDGEALAKALEPLQALSAKMEEAGKPMEALGKKMEALGTEMELATAQAQKKVKEIIQSAKKEGLVAPATKG